MSTAAPAQDAGATRPAEPLPLPPLPAAEPRRRRIRPALVLPLLYLAAALFHAVQGTMQVTPAIFTDELLHSELARAFAEGRPFTVRDEPVFFPSFLPALLQAPAWLVGDMGTAYAVAKALNAFVMSAAVFPAYWLARMLVRPLYALLVAGATVAAPAMAYHQYLLSEALAYPVFLLAFAVLVRALARPSALWGLAAAALSVVAVGTRMQFLALPLVFALLVVVRPRLLRKHAIAAAALALLGVAALLGGRGLLGTYNGFLALDVSPWPVAGWAASAAILLPFAAGVLVAPGGVLGLGLLAVRPRTTAEAAFARLGLGVGAVFLVQAGMIAAGDAARPLGRYAFYLAPLLVLGFFAYAERGLPHRRVYVALAAALGLGAWLIPFPSLADYRFSFDSPILSAFGELAHVAGTANAATVFGVVPLLAAVALALRLRPAAVGGATIALLLLTGLLTYAGGHAMTQRASAAWAASPADWLDRSGYGRADLLALPGSSPYFAWTLESWNRDFGRPIHLDVERPRTDPWAAGEASVRSDGTLLVDGRPGRAGLLVVNDQATQIGLEGDVLARPRKGLTLVRVPQAPRVAWIAQGLQHDRWASRLLYRAWPRERARRGVYHVRLSLPRGEEARRVVAEVEGGARRGATLAGGESLELTLPVEGGQGPTATLVLTSDRTELLDGDGANPRLVGFRVERLDYVPEPSAPSTAL